MPSGHPARVLSCPALRAEFIAALIALRSVKLATAKCGIGRKSLYRARRRFADFDAAWIAAREGVAWQRSYPESGPSTAERAAFLVALGSGMSISASARLADYHGQLFYHLRSRDADFAAAWAQARAQAVEELESVMVERVIHGFERTVFVGGVARQVRHFDMAAGLRLLERRAAAGADRPRGRIIELTPESVAVARRKVVALLTSQGIAAFEP